MVPCKILTGHLLSSGVVQWTQAERYKAQNAEHLGHEIRRCFEKVKALPAGGIQDQKPTRQISSGTMNRDTVVSQKPDTKLEC